jgi:glycosyltransferase involved in cell wall biosynthesis
LTGVASTPLVSIGVPVYNEAKYIDAALSALRAQDYTAIEIIVCDNASTDDTLAICKRHAESDPRIRIEASEVNCGATANFRRAFELARGEYFMWASGHDLWSPDVIRECIDLLQVNPTACLAYASAEWIDPDGEVLEKRSGWSDTSGLGPIERYFTIFWGNMHPVLGLIRADFLRSCGPLPAFVGGDLVLLADLALRGDFLHARHSKWYRREIRHEGTYKQKVRRYVSKDFGVSVSRLDRMFPLLALPWALVKLVARSRLGLLDKTVMLAALLPSLALRYRVGRSAGGR